MGVDVGRMEVVVATRKEEGTTIGGEDVLWDDFGEGVVGICENQK